MLNIQLFGKGRAHYRDRELIGFPDQQPFLIFAYILLNRQHNLNRDQLSSIIWADCTTHLAHKHLRNGLWRLRRTLMSVGTSIEQYLNINDCSIAFEPVSHYQLDVEQFEKTVVPLQRVPGRGLGPEQAAQLSLAIEFYVGDLLESVDAEWCLYDRERLNLLYLNALGQLMAYHTQTGEYEAALDDGRLILAHDNTRERIHREMMRLYWLTHDRASALAQYRRCVQVLRDELGIDPMDETRHMYEQMRRNQFELAERPVITPALSSASDPPLKSSTQLLARQALHRIRELQTILTETSQELHQLENALCNTSNESAPDSA